MKENNSIWQAIKFALFSISAGIIQVSSFAILNEFVLPYYWPSYLISLLLSIIWNFTLNRRYTFQSEANVPIAMTKLLGFYAVFTPLSTWLGNIAEQACINDYIILAVTMLTNFITEFLFSKFVMYRNQENTLVKKTK